MWQVGNELRRLAHELSGSGLRVAHARGWVPRVDVAETPTEILVRAELAGVKAESLRLTYRHQDHVLVLHGSREEDEFVAGPKKEVHQLEIPFGEFERNIALPDAEIDWDQARARLKAGFLIVVLPKTSAPRLRGGVWRTITIVKV